jgi:uncharacterized protein YqjF (DUF2071 family)
MMHYEVDPVRLQKLVPFELDLYRGSAWISLVAFTLRDMRPRRFGRLGAALLKPIATHEFLNVRTYVKARGEAGIYFLAEWLSNRLSVLLGPSIFGLPYRFGRIAYQHDRFETGLVSGSVCSPDERDRFEYAAGLPGDARFCKAKSGSLAEWLMERYTAFTRGGTQARFFRVWHEPYQQCPATVEIIDQSLIEKSWPMLAGLEPACANFCPGVRDVWMGRPHSVRRITSGVGVAYSS